ncbi:hypothetical protein [Mycobacterium sp. 94-17]|uniref:hypothetical protein n=1 Tax=Mycobacterium sp. 94-17 TaxID=2986147 RepID=UPI002D1ECF60|nr:hypothetical protein [Mycobacterium sp. 94-17]MEB4209548.1 hypothetical protein [Mycobacterium sp. 94-17]
MSVCLPAFRELAAALTNVHCDSRHPIVTFNNPAALQNWTMPVLEEAVLIGTLVLLFHAIGRFRRHGDNSNLVVLVVGLFIPMVVEKVTYFPSGSASSTTWG